jgi:hypothetical protein
VAPSPSVPTVEPGTRAGLGNAHSAAEAHIPQEYLPEPQEYLPEELRGSIFYERGPFGFEKEVAKRLAWWADLKAKVSRPPSPEGDKSGRTSDNPARKSTDEEE